MIKYDAHCEWDGYNWVATVDDLPGAVTQAKRLDLLPARIAEVITLMRGKPTSPDAVDLHYNLDGMTATEVEEIRRLREELEGLQHKLLACQPRAIRHLRDHGFTLRDIGKLVGVSYQRVGQLLKS